MNRLNSGFYLHYGLMIYSDGGSSAWPLLLLN